MKLTTRLQLVLSLRIVELYYPSPKRLHGVLLH
jgi:hypothetical protein